MHRRGALQLFNLSQGQGESQVEGRTYGIPTENDNEYYQVPKNAYEGLEKVQFGDNVGTMLMDNKLYLAFDEIMLYIATTKNELKKYGIKKINESVK